MLTLSRQALAVGEVAVVVFALSGCGSETELDVVSRQGAVKGGKLAPGDINGDNMADIALTGGNWAEVKIAMGSAGVWGTAFEIPLPAFCGFAQNPGARPLSGDFNGDGLADIALIGGNWNSIPMVKGDTLHTLSEVINTPNSAGGVPQWARNPGAKAVSGDFDADGKTDIALTGGNWTTIPVATSVGNGTFNATNNTPINWQTTNFPGWAQNITARAVSGDFNNDGRADIALVGGSGWGTVPVAFGQGGGNFFVTNGAAGSFPSWAQNPAAQVVVGDFNADGKDDIALGGGAWSTIPVALSNGDGTFTTQNGAVASFPGWAQNPGAKLLAGDYNADGKADLALTGGSGWSTIPVTFSIGNGTFGAPFNPSGNLFSGYAQSAGAKPVSGH